MKSSLLTNRCIVVVGQQPWDVSIGSNCKNIALEFSKHNRVLYVNSPLDRMNGYRHKNDPKIQKRLRVIQGKENGLVKISENLWNLYPNTISESVSFIKNKSLFDYFNRINNRRIAKVIERAMQELQFSNSILFNDNDIYRSFYLKEMLQPQLSLYYVRDYMLAVDYWKRHGERLEPQLIAKSDICVANSTYLADYCRQYNPRSYYVGQGCDLSLFSEDKYKVPIDMQPLMNNPVIGYVGALQTLRLDIDILLHIAEQRPQYNIVLVGPEDEGFQQSRLHQLPNVFFLGAKSPEALPQYINTFSVCLNPQVLNQVTIGNYPRKIDEYLAMGKPAVATNTKAMEIFRNYTYLADTKEDYLHLIDKALAEDNTQKAADRKHFAATHTWEDSVACIYNTIENATHSSATVKTVAHVA
jgi:glycosyltransferase involved in cell wall biosynthesis